MCQQLTQLPLVINDRPLESTSGHIWPLYETATGLSGRRCLLEVQSDMAEVFRIWQLASQLCVVSIISTRWDCCSTLSRFTEGWDQQHVASVGLLLVQPTDVKPKLYLLPKTMFPFLHLVHPRSTCFLLHSRTR